MPTTIKYVSSKGHPAMQVILDTPCLSVRIQKEWRQKLKHPAANIYQVPANIGHQFFHINEKVFGSYFDAVVAKDSLTHYYGFQDLYSDIYRCSTDLTEKFISAFAERGDKMIRHELNLDGQSTNCLGMKMPEFEHVLYENGYQNNEVGDFSEHELNCFVRALGEDCGIVQNIRKFINNNNMDESEIDNVEAEIEQYEEGINNAISAIMPEITEFKNTLPSREFCCGFTFVKTLDESIKAKYECLKQNGRRSSATPNINFPDDYMNCYNSQSILDFIKEKTKNDNIQKLYVQTMLD